MRGCLILLIGTSAVASGFASHPLQAQPEKVVGNLLLEHHAFRNEPWSGVFTWLSDQTGKPVIASAKVPGTFTHLPPPGKRYTESEFLRIVNNSLRLRGAVLVPSPGSFTVLWFDDHS